MACVETLLNEKLSLSTSEIDAKPSCARSESELSCHSFLSSSAKFSSKAVSQVRASTLDRLRSRKTNKVNATPLSPTLFTAEIQKVMLRKREGILLNDNGAVISGSLEALVEMLIPRHNYFPEKSFLFAFLLNSRIFMPPSELLHEVLKFCILEQDAATERFKKDSVTRFFLNIVRLLKEWTENFPYDFRDSAMLVELNELLGLCASADGALKQHTVVLLQNLLNTLAKVDRYEMALRSIKGDLSFELVPSETLGGLIEVCTSPVVVAQQLTHIELERLSMIGPDELVEYFEECKKTNVFPDSTKPDRKYARNIHHYAEWFNRLSHLVGTEVCKHLRKKHRVKLADFFIQVAKECFNIGNFNSLMAIVAGLNMVPVARLKKTWLKVNMTQLEVLEHQLNPTGNFLSYRSTLKAAVWRSEGAVHPCEKIVVPFFTLLIKDLFYLHESCIQKLPNGHLNFAVFTKFAEHVLEFMVWKKVDCPFDRDPAVLHYLLANPVFCEAGLQLASFECEPPETSADKELQKELKIQLNWPR